jgi:hypothetical protein
MTPGSIECARGMRDAGIDAMAALSSVWPELQDGLSEQEARELRHTFGAVMAEVVDKLINPAVRAFPELQTDQATWSAVAKERATARLELP